MLNLTRNSVVSNRRWKSESGIDLCPSDLNSEAHVLAVDDNLVDRKVIEKLLRTSSCRVTAVDSGIRALEFLGLDDDHQTSVDNLKVDLIITDYCMPGMTGYELLKRIKNSSNFKEVPVVIMSSENVITRIDRCLEEGAEDFILKPVKSADVKRIKDYLSKEDRSNGGRESGINKRKERDGSDLSSDSSQPSTRSPPSDISLSSELQSLPSISSSSVSPFSSSPSSPSGPLDSPSTPTSPSPPLDSLIEMDGLDENAFVSKSDGLE